VSTLRQRAQRRKLPAYGRELLELRLRNLVPPGVLLVGLDDWLPGAHTDRCKIIVPAEEDIARLDFCPLAGLAMFVSWWPSRTPIGRRDTLIRALLRVEPRLLWVCDREHPERSITVARERKILIPEFTLGLV